MNDNSTCMIIHSSKYTNLPNRISFFDAIDRIKDDAYIPSNDDILRFKASYSKHLEFA